MGSFGGTVGIPWNLWGVGVQFCGVWGQLWGLGAALKDFGVQLCGIEGFWGLILGVEGKPGVKFGAFGVRSGGVSKQFYGFSGAAVWDCSNLGSFLPFQDPKAEGGHQGGVGEGGVRRGGSLYLCPPPNFVMTALRISFG